MIVTANFTQLFLGKDLEQRALYHTEDYWTKIGLKAIAESDLIGMGYKTEHELDYIMYERNGKYLTALPDGTVYDSERDDDRWQRFQNVDYQFIDIPTFSESDTIPKIIHQTDNAKQPRAQFNNNIAQLKEMNPNWEYRYYSEQARHDYIYKNYGWDVLNTYLRINRRYGAARADLFRYLVIYKEGGLYLDMKSGLSKPVDEILNGDDRMFLSGWSRKTPGPQGSWGQYYEAQHYPHGSLQQWFILSKAGNPAIRKLILQVLANVSLYSPNIQDVGNFAAVRTTGPGPFSKVMYAETNEKTARLGDSLEDGIIYNNVPNYTKVFDYSKQETPLAL